MAVLLILSSAIGSQYRAKTMGLASLDAGYFVGTTTGLWISFRQFTIAME
jgi:hypothetical protein